MERKKKTKSWRFYFFSVHSSLSPSSSSILLLWNGNLQPTCGHWQCTCPLLIIHSNCHSKNPFSFFFFLFSFFFFFEFFWILPPLSAGIWCCESWICRRGGTKDLLPCNVSHFYFLFLFLFFYFFFPFPFSFCVICTVGMPSLCAIELLHNHPCCMLLFWFVWTNCPPSPWLAAVL